jgi:tRNA(Ile)-lysidine synthase
MTSCKALADSSTPKPTRSKARRLTGLAGGVSGGTSAAANPAFTALAAFVGVHPFSADAGTGSVGVAYSGGADSTALLVAATALWPGQVQAMHVHHGLQAAADDFVGVCQQTCQRLDVPLHVLRVNARAAPGDSPEDAARRARYRALSQTALHHGLNSVLLGQHADDQVETVLLALSRGAGLPGLAAMPAQFRRGGMLFQRPLLAVTADALREWLQAQHIAFVDDPSNRDERYTRNRIRAQLLPVLSQVFPQFRQTVARSAQHAAQAQGLLDELAAQDLLQTGSPPVLGQLQQLSPARQSNVIRHWLAHAHQVAPSTAQLAQLVRQVAACTTRGHRIDLKVAGGHVHRLGDALQYASAADKAPPKRARLV